MNLSGSKQTKVSKVPREGLKPRASPSVFNTSLSTLRMLMNGKSCLIPLFNVVICGAALIEYILCTRNCI